MVDENVDDPWSAKKSTILRRQQGKREGNEPVAVLLFQYSGCLRDGQGVAQAVDT